MYTYLNTRYASFAFGTIFVLVGLLGFIPNPLVAPDGVFAVNAAHNLVHILTGGAFFFCALKWPGREGTVIKVIGIAYLAVALLGLVVSGDMLLGIVHINNADRWLHFALAAVILTAGFALSGHKTKALGGYAVDN